MPAVRACAALGAARALRARSPPSEIRARCDSPLFRTGRSLPQAATVQPALLARACARRRSTRASRSASAPGRGGSQPGPAARSSIETDRGARVRAATAVLAINAAAAGFRAAAPPACRHLDPHDRHRAGRPTCSSELGWTGGECISTARRYLHYFRTTSDGRIAFGWGGGRLAYGGRLGGRIEVDRRHASSGCGPTSCASSRACAGAGSRPPGAGRSTSRRPTCRASAPCRIAGSTTSAVSPATASGPRIWPARCSPRWRSTAATGSPVSALVEPAQPPVPPEPLRYLGGSLVRAALLRQEDREDCGPAGRPVDQAGRRDPGATRDPRRALKPRAPPEVKPSSGIIAAHGTGRPVGAREGRAGARVLHPRRPLLAWLRRAARGHRDQPREPSPDARRDGRERDPEPGRAARGLPARARCCARPPRSRRRSTSVPSDRPAAHGPPARRVPGDRRPRRAPRRPRGPGAASGRTARDAHEPGGRATLPGSRRGDRQGPDRPSARGASAPPWSTGSSSQR